MIMSGEAAMEKVRRYRAIVARFWADCTTNMAGCDLR
jgi:hypothetical protein